MTAYVIARIHTLVTEVKRVFSVMVQLSETWLQGMSSLLLKTRFNVKRIAPNAATGHHTFEGENDLMRHSYHLSITHDRHRELTDFLRFLVIILQTAPLSGANVGV